MMKFYGGALLFIGAYLTFANPWFILLVVLGLLLFLQGMEKSIASLIVECIRSDKSPDEIEADRKREAGPVPSEGPPSEDDSNKTGGR